MLKKSVFYPICSEILTDVTGVVRWFNTSKNFGFIDLDNRSESVFVHFTQLEIAGIETLSTGDCLTLDVYIQSDNRTAAKNLRLISKAESNTIISKVELDKIPTKEGKVLVFDEKRGIGYIRPRDGSEDIFFYQQTLDLFNNSSLNIRNREVIYKVGPDHNLNNSKAVLIKLL